MNAKRPIPELTDDEIHGLIERVLGTPEAAEIGLVRMPYEDPYGRYLFTKRAGDGGHDAGDRVSPGNFRCAMQAVMDLRGNYGDDRAVVGAYWDMLRKPPAEWAITSILALASMAPLQGAMEDQRETSERGGTA